MKLAGGLLDFQPGWAYIIVEPLPEGRVPPCTITESAYTWGIIVEEPVYTSYKAGDMVLIFKHLTIDKGGGKIFYLTNNENILGRVRPSTELGKGEPITRLPGPSKED